MAGKQRHATMPMKNKARRRVAICMNFSNKLLNGIQLDVNFPEKAAFTSATRIQEP
jgi:hypothetical protein